MIRPLYITDIPAAVKFLGPVCAELKRSYDPASCASSLLRAVGQNHRMVIYEEDGMIKGMAVLIVVPAFTDVKEIRAIEALWHSDPSLTSRKRARIMLELKEDMESFCREHGYRGPYLSPNMEGHSGGLVKHLERHGYSQKEAIWAI